MNKVYLVIEDYANDSDLISESYVNVFATYEKAKKHFNLVKERIISYDLGYDDIEEKEDYYCEWQSGEYHYYHELVHIEEKEVL